MNNYVNQMDWGHNPSEADRAYAKAKLDQDRTELMRKLAHPDLIPANSGPSEALSSHSEAPAAPTPPPPVLDPLNWKGISPGWIKPDFKDDNWKPPGVTVSAQELMDLNNLVEFWRERALKAEKEVEDLVEIARLPPLE